MKKLKLDLKDLKVESFETTKKHKISKGTVVGFASGDDLTCISGVCACPTMEGRSCPIFAC